MLLGVLELALADLPLVPLSESACEELVLADNWGPLQTIPLCFKDVLKRSVASLLRLLGNG